MMRFPDGFLWGSATAAHQVEGDNRTNDWWDWEQTPGHIKNGDRSTLACDWWHGERYRADFDLAKSLNQNAHRLSVEWSRIEPREGEWNQDALAYYRRVLTALRDRGMTPLVTLHHFSNPRWLAQKGAWETQTVVPFFERYATQVVQELGDLCKFWVTINEPFVYTFFGYNDGTFPPGQKNVLLAFRVLGNLVRGHAAAYHAIHRVQPDAQVGVAHHFRAFAPANPRSALDRCLVGLRDRLANRLFFLALVDGKLRFPLSVGEQLTAAAGTQDFIGINYYFTERAAFALNRPGQLFTREVKADWPPDAPSFAAHVEPNSLYKHLCEQARYGKPIYITENGLFDLGGDPWARLGQARYLLTHLMAVQRAIQAGVPVNGLFYWTLVDNFEWAHGYTARFGLYRLDLASQTRTPRVTADVYARIARDNAIPDDLIEKYGH
ncbi:MAG: glycoside hydrolase family 1 protein [Chloroflexi bacterium]|nr:glycoside hydrolase family 1 protein [Chloroflexota bacterium]